MQETIKLLYLDITGCKIDVVIKEANKKHLAIIYTMPNNHKAMLICNKEGIKEITFNTGEK